MMFDIANPFAPPQAAPVAAPKTGLKQKDFDAFNTAYAKILREELGKLLTRIEVLEVALKAEQDHGVNELESAIDRFLETG